MRPGAWFGAFVIVAALSVGGANTAGAQVSGDMSAACGDWAFEPALEMEEGARPAAVLPCGDDLAFIVVCVVGDFIAGLRYYGPPDGDGLDYQEFRFAAGERSVTMYLRYEALDAAWATYTEFDHPLFTTIREEAGPLGVTRVAGGEDALLPLRGSARSLAGLRAACVS